MNQYVEYGKYSYGKIIPLVSSLEQNQNVQVKVGRFCSIAENVIAEFRNHRMDRMTTFPLHDIPDLGANFSKTMAGSHKGNICIGNDVWIGRDVTLLSGISIGDGAVIGARSVVTKDVAPYAVCCGNPSKEIKKRFSNEKIAFLLDYEWWNMPFDKLKKIIKIMTDPDWFSYKSELIIIKRDH